MKNCFLYLGLGIATLSATSCAALMTPYSRGFYGRHPGLRTVPAVTVDPVAAARGRWDNVMRLAPGSIVDVLTQNGLAYVGGFSAADGYSVRVVVGGNEREIARADILRIDLVSPPGSDAGAVAKGAVRGAALGVGLVALVSGVIGGEAWPPPAVVWRGGAAIGGVAGGETALARRQGRLVYLAESQQPISGAAAHSVLDWPTVVDLPVDTRVVVLTTSGGRHPGTFIAADDASIRIDVGDAELRIPRESVKHVEVLRERASQVRGRRQRSSAVKVIEFIDSRIPVTARDIVAVPGAVPLVRMGAAPLPIGGAQSPIFAMTMRPVAGMPGPGGAAPAAGPPLMLPRAGARSAICHGPGVSLARR